MKYAEVSQRLEQQKEKEKRISLCFNIFLVNCGIKGRKWEGSNHLAIGVLACVSQAIKNAGHSCFIIGFSIALIPTNVQETPRLGGLVRI